MRTPAYLLVGFVTLGSSGATAWAQQPPSFVLHWGSQGSGDGQFDEPNGVAVDEAGHIYVTDGHNERLQKFDGSGVFLGKWGSFGSADGQFFLPYAIENRSRRNTPRSPFAVERIALPEYPALPWNSPGTAKTRATKR